MTNTGTMSRERYWDKVYACWLGKNCGGTLGSPLEKVFGEPEPFSIDWYPELREGGIPNDDLEMQLIWLKAIEERGFHLTARDLAQYWLDHIGYNWDEYGLNKTNLRLGLLPPVSGYFNNWFRDCMGAPIRSELWACLAPGVPGLAARYAYEDAIVDHAGGEGVWGEIFNAALESAAFVESDPQILLDIALSYLPPACATARAVRVARAAYASGIGWREARAEVLQATPHYVAQYAPPNIGFQVIGWLYGKDFGDALCTAVNCGYDTDCTGGSLGALLGILGGRAGLPTRWTAPLGESIATNESWGGLRHASQTPRPIPTTLRELTDRVCTLGEQLLLMHNAPLRIGNEQRMTATHTLSASSEDIAALTQTSPLTVKHVLTNVEVTVTYLHSPALLPGVANRIEVDIHNPHPEALNAVLSLSAPAQWQVEPAGDTSCIIPSYSHISQRFTIQVDDPAFLANSNQLHLQIRIQERPAESIIPVVFVGARHWLVWGPEPSSGIDADELLDQAEQTEPYDAAGQLAPGWHVFAAEGNALPDQIGSDWVGSVRAHLALWNPRERPVRIGIPATCPRVLWINGQQAHRTHDRTRLRPGYIDDGASYIDARLRQGWNTLSLAYTRGETDPLFAAHLTLADIGLYSGLTDVVWTHHP